MFAPGIKIISNLRFRQKFSLLLMIFLLPLMYASFVIYYGGRTELLQLEARERGFEVVEELHFLRILAAQHRGIAAQWLNGDVSAKDKLLPIEREMLSKIDAAKGSMQNNNIDQEIIDALVEASTTWTLLTHDKLEAMGAEQSFTLHTTWVDEVKGVIYSLSNATYIVLDDHIDTYFLGQISVRLIPYLQEYTGQLRGLGSGIAASGALSNSDSLYLSSLYDRLNEFSEEVDENFKHIKRVSPDAYEKISTIADDLNKKLDRFLDATERAFLDTSSPSISANDYFSLGTEAIKAMGILLSEVNGVYRERTQVYVSETNLNRIIVFGLFGVLVVLGLYLFSCVRMGVNNNLERIQEMASCLAKGEISKEFEVDSGDEFGEVIGQLNDSFNSLRQIILNIRDQSSEQTQTAQSLTASASESNSLGLNQQNQLKDIVSATRNISSSGRNVSELCQQAMQETGVAGKNAHQGVERSSLSAKSIRQLAEGIRQAGTDIDDLAQQTEQIVSVIDVIKSVAEQTNLLALNAAIEAARAGEQGRGFAVVADEVRTLANRTQESTNEIEVTIDALQKVAEKAVKTMNEAVDQANSGEKAAEETGEALAHIEKMIGSIADVIEQVAGASKQQSKGLDDITQNVEHVSTAANQLFSYSESVNSTASSLKGNAEKMDEEVRRFSV